jgi:VWFA-related protein
LRANRGRKKKPPELNAPGKARHNGGPFLFAFRAAPLRDGSRFGFRNFEAGIPELGCAILFIMPISRFIRVLSLTLLAAFLPAIAQAAPQAAESKVPSASAAPAPAIPVSVKEVNLLAIVRDKKGQPVTSLDKQDFVLEQDGRAQTITQFAHETSLPLTLGVLADTGPGQRKVLADERKAATDFVNRLLRQGTDHGFVLHFDKEVELLQDVTTSHDKLAKGIDEISVGGAPRDSRSGQRGGRGRDNTDGSHSRFFFGGGMLYDAIFLSADEVLKGQQGRKAMVLFSDGEDRDSKMSLARAIEAAQRAETIVYCVYVAPEREEQGGGESGGDRPGGYPGGGYPGGSYPGGGYPGGGYPGPFPGGGRRRGPESTPRENRTDGKKILQQIASETGGRYFELSKKMSAEQIYAQIEQELRHQYSLSYTPDKTESGYHKLHLSTRNGDWRVQTRPGYYAD